MRGHPRAAHVVVEQAGLRGGGGHASTVDHPAPSAIGVSLLDSCRRRVQDAASRSACSRRPPWRSSHPCPRAPCRASIPRRSARAARAPRGRARRPRRSTRPRTRALRRLRRRARTPSSRSTDRTTGAARRPTSSAAAAATRASTCSPPAARRSRGQDRPGREGRLRGRGRQLRRDRPARRPRQRLHAPAPAGPRARGPARARRRAGSDRSAAPATPTAATCTSSCGPPRAGFAARRSTRSRRCGAGPPHRIRPVPPRLSPPSDLWGAAASGVQALPGLPRLPIVPDLLRRIDMPDDLDAVLVRGDEAEPRSVGMSRAGVERIWEAALGMYRSGAHPAAPALRAPPRGGRARPRDRPRLRQRARRARRREGAGRARHAVRHLLGLEGDHRAVVHLLDQHGELHIGDPSATTCPSSRNTARRRSRSPRCSPTAPACPTSRPRRSTSTCSPTPTARRAGLRHPAALPPGQAAGLPRGLGRVHLRRSRAPGHRAGRSARCSASEYSSPSASAG